MTILAFLLVNISKSDNELKIETYLCNFYLFDHLTKSSFLNAFLLSYLKNDFVVHIWKPLVNISQGLRFVGYSS